jgi:signal transduction histidine kinase
MSVALLGPDMKLHSEERIRQTIERIGRQITRMERMVGDFLDIAKIEAGQLDLRFDTHDARKLVEEIVDLLEGASQKHRLELRVPDHAVPLRCDQLRIGQVITNLISNAIKYSPEGGVVDVTLESHGGEVELRVTDRGMGIAECDRARIFEPFRRVGLSKETAPGAGLGLFIVRQIVEAHRGRIEVESAPGKGSTFRVFLPVENTAP